MRTVLYAHDMEPITVLWLEPWAVKFLKERTMVCFAVFPPLSFKPLEMPIVSSVEGHIVTITAEYFRRNGEEHMFLFTHDEAPAMRLKSQLLPGQREQHRADYMDAFMDGFLSALRAD